MRKIILSLTAILIITYCFSLTYAMDDYNHLDNTSEMKNIKISDMDDFYNIFDNSDNHSYAMSCYDGDSAIKESYAFFNNKFSFEIT